MVTRHELDVRADFGQRYSGPRARVVRDVERAVIGAAWGANGFTTVAQADELARRLDLGPGRRLLDVGSGRGWPGLYLAARTGCDVVLTDLLPEGLVLARRRARRERVRWRGAVVASARDLPFAPASFDAIVHTDVLC